MLAHDFPFDTCQMPLNVFDGTYRSFEQTVLPVLNQRGIAPLGMKSLSGNAEPIKQGIVTPEEAIRYVLSLPIASLVSGIDSRQVLKQNLDIVRVDEARQLLLVKGAVPGATGSDVIVRSAVKAG